MLAGILLTGWIYEGLLILALCTHFTAVQRIIHVQRLAGREG